LTGEIAEIDERLAKVESSVIKNATVVGATLTKTYLSDDIQARKFDTVILDEASMAPIPALWVAALLAEHNLIIVGDFKQLPPIVLSNREATIKWLGRDIFEASGLKAVCEKGTPPDYFVMLTEQSRFLEEIASIANLFYGNLRTLPQRQNEVDQFLRWYKSDWPNDSPVVLVDTGSLNAWVTSVVKHGSSSRLNFRLPRFRWISGAT
jgi:superfamily I DNA and/or RNA helicase